MKKQLITTLYILLVPFFLWCADLNAPELIDNWFAANPRAADYLSLKNALHDIQKQTTAHNLPFEFIFNKFLEGVAKNAAAAQVLKVLLEEEQRLEAIVRMIDKVDAVNREKNKKPYFQWMQEESLNSSTTDTLTGLIPQALVFRNRTEIITQIAIFIRSGISLTVMEKIFLSAQQQGIPFFLPFYLFSEIIKIPAFSRLTDREIYRLNDAILSSSLSPSSYAVIPSLFLKGSRYNLDYPVIVNIIVEKLEQGGSFIRIEQEFRRRER